MAFARVPGVLRVFGWRSLQWNSALVVGFFAARIYCSLSWFVRRRILFMLLVTAAMRVWAFHANEGREDLGGTPRVFTSYILYIF